MSKQIYYVFCNLKIPGEDYIVEQIKHVVKFGEEPEQILRSDVYATLRHLDGEVHEQRISHHMPGEFKNILPTEFIAVTTGIWKGLLEALVFHEYIRLRQTKIRDPRNLNVRMRAGVLKDEGFAIPTALEVKEFLIQILPNIDTVDQNRAMGLIQRLRLHGKEVIQ